MPTMADMPNDGGIDADDGGFESQPAPSPDQSHDAQVDGSDQNPDSQSDAADQNHDAQADAADQNHDAQADGSDAAGDPAAPADLSAIGDEARRALEAVIMVADQPVDSALLAQLVERTAAQVDDLLAGLAASYEEDGRGFQLVRVAGGWRYQSHQDLSSYVERFVLSGQSARLSAAALETLAIVAYKQPISRAQVSAIRGVSVDGVMRTLQQRGYIAEVGKDPGPGNPSMFATTSLFLEKVGLNDVSELPSLGDFIPGADVVELLEQGLRAEPEPDGDAAPADAEPPSAGAEPPTADGAAASDDASAQDAQAVGSGVTPGESASSPDPGGEPDEPIVDVTEEQVIDVGELPGGDAEGE